MEPLTVRKSELVPMAVRLDVVLPELWDRSLVLLKEQTLEFVHAEQVGQLKRSRSLYAPSSLVVVRVLPPRCCVEDG